MSWTPEQKAAIDDFISWTRSDSLADPRFYNQAAAEALIRRYFDDIKAGHQLFLEGKTSVDPVDIEGNLATEYWFDIRDLAIGARFDPEVMGYDRYEHLEGAFYDTLKLLFGTPDEQEEARDDIRHRLVIPAETPMEIPPPQMRFT